jgi:nickel/cobalt exporter
MAWRTRQERYADEHHHHDEPHQVEIGGSSFTLKIFEDGVPPRWRIQSENGELPNRTKFI